MGAPAGRLARADRLGVGTFASKIPLSNIEATSSPQPAPLIAAARVIAYRLSYPPVNHGTASRLVLEARRGAGLSQRALAHRARTAQSVVARIESGTTSPSWETLNRLLHAAGFALSASLVPRLRGRSHMLGDVPRILRLTPEERLLELRNADRLFKAAVRRFP